MRKFHRSYLYSERGSIVTGVFSLVNSKVHYGVFVIFFVVNIGLFILSSVFAYVGPGAGLSVVGTIVALIVAIILAIVGFIWYPFKRILAKLKSTRGPTE